MFKIVLDAGHGLYTQGKRCLKSLDPNETREWVLNSRICDKIEDKLKSYKDYSLLRVDYPTGKEDIGLSKRTNAANNWGADIYLSVHHNAGINGGSGGGPVTIIYKSPTETEVKYQKIIHEEFEKQVGKFGNRADEMPTQNLHVCRETVMPAVLIECGFMDSKIDVPMILSEEFAEKAAKGLTNALVKIGNLQKEEPKVKENKFVDIKGHYAESAIKDLYNMGIVNGVDENHYAPNEKISRGDMAILIRNAIRYITGK